MRSHTQKTSMMVLIAIASLALIPAAAQGAVTLTFSTPDFEWHQTGGLATPYHIWATGDYWAQDFLSTGLTGANAMSLHLDVDHNTLSATNAVDLDVILNTTTVGSISIPSGVTGPVDFLFTFAAVAGPDYRLQLLETNTVPGGAGALSIGINGPSYATLTPEPASLSLLTLGALAMTRRKR